jgi:hypothetical protein
MGLFFAFLLIALPTAAMLYDFYKGGENTMLSPQPATPQRAAAPPPPTTPTDRTE